MAVGGLSGTSGPCVFVRQRDGRQVLRVRTTPSDPKTAAQMAMRLAMQRAAATFSQLTPEEHRAWLAYARQLAENAWSERRTVPVNATNAYRTLALKILQLDREAELPRTPPSTPFGGDAVRVTVGAEPGGLVFTSDRGNLPGVSTELLTQPVRLSISRTDPQKFRSQGFVAFGQGGQDVRVAAQRGWVVPAYRFVLAATGQTTPLLPLEPVWVGPAGTVAA